MEKNCLEKLTLSFLLGLFFMPLCWAERQALLPPEPLPNKEGIAYEGTEHEIPYYIRYNSGRYIVNFSWKGEEYTITYAPSTNIKPLVKAEVDAHGDVFTYKYTIVNATDSNNTLYSLAVEYNGFVYDVKSPNKNWYKTSLSFYPAITWSDTKSDSKGVRIGQELRGFSFKARAYPQKKEVRFSTGKKSETGFFFSSGSLPGVVKCYVSAPRARLESDKVIPIELPSEISGYLPKRKLERSVLGETIGPVSIPSNLNGVTLIARLKEYVVKAYRLGWVEGEEVYDDVIVRLDDIESYLEKGKREKVIVLVKQLEAKSQAYYRKNKLFSEAHALLRDNLQYLHNHFGDLTEAE